MNMYSMNLQYKTYMKQMKWIIILLVLLSCVSSCNYFGIAKTIDDSIELKDDEIGTLYKEYIVKKSDGQMRLKNHFNYKEINLGTEDIKEIIDIQDSYELIQLEDKIYSKTLNKVKSIDGVKVSKVDLGYIFQRDGKYGLLDKELNILIEPQYEELYMGEKSTLLLAKLNDKYGYLDKNGKVIIPFEYKSASNEKNGFMVVKKNNNKIGVIDKTNHVVIDFKFDAIYYNKGDVFITQENGEYFFSVEGAQIKKIDASWIGVQNEDTLFYEKDGKFGILNLKGEILTENDYNQLSMSYKNLIIAMKIEKYGLIDNKGQIKLSFVHDYILPVGDNYFKVGSDINGYVFLVNQEGRALTKQIYDDFFELNENYVIALKENKIILLNSKGHKIDIIDKILAFNKDMILFSKNKKNILKKL